MNRKIYFRADASADIGYGHFIRSLALADMLKDGFDCTFFTANPTEYQVEEMKKVCGYVALDEVGESETFIHRLQGDEVVVLDNYFYTTEYQQQIKTKGCKLVVIDDVHDRHFVADVLICHGIEDTSLFDVEPYTRLCLGLQWALLRKPFLDAATHRLTMKRQETIAICFGGSDLSDYTSRYIRQGMLQYPDYHIVAIVGDKYRPQSDLIHNRNVEYRSNLNADDMALLFSMCELVVCSASTVCIEALACGAKVAAGWYVGNQCDFYNYIHNRDLVFGLNDLRKTEAVSLPTVKQLTTLHSVAFQNVRTNYINLFKLI